MSLLPEGYKRLLYIESTGTQYINTGVVAGASVGADFVIQNTGAASAGGCFMSAYGGSDCTKVTYYYATGGKVVANHGGSGYVTILAAQDTVKHTVCARPTFVTVDGTKYALSGNGGLTIPLYLFAENSSGKPVDNGSYRLYSCKLYNGTIILRNFIPCINGAGEVGLYDAVNGVFCGNSGTGVFIAGPEFWYDELEYIESNGTQYIDTGFVTNQDSRIVMDAMLNAVTTSNVGGYLFGSCYPVLEKGFEAYAYDGIYKASYNSIDAGGSVSAQAGQRVYVDFNKNVCVMKTDAGVVFERTFAASSFTSAVSLHLFVLPRSARFYGNYKLYSCEVYDNGAIVRDYIPAKLLDGSIGLIDKLTDEFYPNMGTGVFTAGKVKPTKYMELEYIESTGTQYINTGFIPDQDTRVVMDIDTTNAQGQSFPSLFSTDSSGSYKQRFTTMIYMEQAGFHDHYGATAINSSNIGVYGRLQVDKNKNVTYLNGNAVSNFAYTTFKGTVPLVLLASLDQGVYQYQIKAKLYSCEVYDNGTLLFDFAPIKLYDGTVGLLDKVSGLFYGNAGTGTFVAGPELYGLDENTVLLLHGEDIADSSDYRNAITNNGVAASTGQSKFGGKALYFNGSSELSFPSSQVEFGFGDFTVDFWVYPESVGKDCFFLNVAASVGGGFFFGIGVDMIGGNLGIGRHGIAWDTNLGAKLTTGKWQHVALVRKDGKYSAYIDGVLKGAVDNPYAASFSGTPAYIGGAGGNYFYKGYIDEYRISNIARWSGNFAVQNKAYSAIVKMPPVPTDLEHSVADSTITLTWTGSEAAAGYNVYRNGELVATVTDTTYSEEIQPSIGYTYEVTAFNDFGETEPALVEVAPSAAPPVPTNLRVMFADFASAQIAWDASVGATAYRVYRDGEFLAETESRIFADSGLSKDTEYVYTVTAINVVGESSTSSLTVKTSDFTLITDRTAADVEFALAQALNPDRNNTEWLKGLKGTYNATDLNRVEKAVEYVANRLEIAGWRRKPAVKIDWSFSDFPTVSEMQRYLDNIRLLRAALPEGMPAVPSDMNGFTYIEANTIEQILLLLDAAVTNIMLNIYYSNEKYSGEVK